MKEFGIAQAKGKLLVVACEPLEKINAVSPREFPHASNALAYLENGGQVIFHGKDDTVAEILKFTPIVERQRAVAAANTQAGLGQPPAELEPELEPEPERSSCINSPGRWDVMISYTQRNANAKRLAAKLYSGLRERGTYAGVLAVEIFDSMSDIIPQDVTNA